MSAVIVPLVNFRQAKSIGNFLNGNGKNEKILQSAWIINTYRRFFPFTTMWQNKKATRKWPCLYKKVERCFFFCAKVW